MGGNKIPPHGWPMSLTAAVAKPHFRFAWKALKERCCPGPRYSIGLLSSSRRIGSTPKRNRTEEELALIEQKMSQLGTKNREAYLRKMALDGYVVQLDLPELKELVSLLRRSSNNLNQLTRRVHETGRIYDADLEDISQRQEQLWEGVREILTQLSKLS